MNVDAILKMLNKYEVEYLLIGGMNFLLRHEPVVTYDVDVWIADNETNLTRCERALIELEAQWGKTETEWGPVSTLAKGWLSRQSMYCLTSLYGAIDVFRQVKGLDWASAVKAAVAGQTEGGVSYRGLSDEDMLESQLHLEPQHRKQARIDILTKNVTETDNQHEG